MLLPTNNRRLILPSDNVAGERIATVLCILAFALWASIVTPLAVEFGPVIVQGFINVLSNP